MPEYQRLTDDELLHLGEQREQLTDEARLELDGELSRRKLSSGDIDTYRVGREAADKADELQRATPKYVYRGAIGLRFYGKANRRFDHGGLSELYETTRWFIVFWFPVFPIASYTVRRSVVRKWRFSWYGDEVAAERHPRNWEQILLTWVKAAAVLLSLRLAFLLLVVHPEWLKRL